MIEWWNPSLNDVEDPKEIKLTLDGWKPLVIRYGLFYPLSGVTQIYWQVQGTAHVFVDPVKVVYEHHHGDFQAHFSKVLVEFRKDYLQWWRDGWPQPWMKGYWDFGSHIFADTPPSEGAP